MLVQFSKQYEAGGPFNTGAGGGTADYAFCMLFGMLSMLMTFPILPFNLPPIFCRNMIYYVLYVWSKRNPTAQANIWGFPVQAIYLPFAYLAMTVFMGSSYLDMIHGIAIGHIYYFLVDVIPAVYGKDVLTTPRFLIDYFGIGEFQPAQQQAAPRPVAGGGGGRPVGRVGGVGGGGGEPPAAPQRGGGGHNWGGGGNALGTN
jgi:Derlin-2/3